MKTHFPTVPIEIALQHSNLNFESLVRPLALIADDEAIICETLKAILNRAGIGVVCATNGADALELARVSSPELLITDYQMPGMNGMELAARVKETSRHCEVIVFSGNLTLRELADESRESGLEIVTLAKPVHPAKLLEVVRERLTASRRSAEQARIRGRVQLSGQHLHDQPSN